MQVIDAATVEERLAYPALVDVLDRAFRDGAIAPPRHHHHVPLEGGRPEATWLLMPAIQASRPGSTTAGRYMGMKSVTVFPDNATRGKPAIFGTYLLLSAETGETYAVLDATRLTVWRTAAASALASRYLSRPDTSTMLMVGAGALSPYLIRAHASVRPMRDVMIWNRTAEAAERVAKQYASDFSSAPYTVRAVTDLEAAVRHADLVSCATLSSVPLVLGAWLKPGTHVDCVGAYKPTLRETDDALVARARIYADTMAGCFGEAGDILQPLNAGVITKSAVLGDLYDLTRGTVRGRGSVDEITVFKSVGASIEDLAAAIAVYEARPS
jgi:ornithine cyclodeaminase/alanine dehydrogenase-like protein (mu-crystallin family)